MRFNQLCFCPFNLIFFFFMLMFIGNSESHDMAALAYQLHYNGKHNYINCKNDHNKVHEICLKSIFLWVCIKEQNWDCGLFLRWKNAFYIHLIDFSSAQMHPSSSEQDLLWNRSFTLRLRGLKFVSFISILYKYRIFPFRRVEVKLKCDHSHMLYQDGGVSDKLWF